MKLNVLIGGLAAIFALVATPAFAEDGLTGEGSLSAGVNTGNTDTKDLGAALKLAKQFGDWRAKGALAADYSETDNNETRNRLSGAAQLDRDINDRLYLFGRGSYEKDAFSSFDNRVFVGVGAGYKILTGERTKWAVEAGPGYRWDELSTGAGLVPRVKRAVQSLDLAACRQLVEDIQCLDSAGAILEKCQAVARSHYAELM